MRNIGLKFVSCSILLFIANLSIAQVNMMVPDLTKIVTKDGWKVFNRKAEIIKENDEVSVYFNAQQGSGVTWLEGVEFNNGIIEADIKGKDLQGRSFVGIAFRGVDEKTYDGIYFRQFNFKSDNPTRKSHSVQYISHPEYSWSRLRKEHPEKYENPVNPVPEPNSFFHIKIVIDNPKVSVYVNNSKNPCLVVEELTNRKGGWVGLWVGNNSDGTFSNLKIIPVKNK